MEVKNSMKQNELILLLILFLFACPQQEKKSTSTTSTQTQVYTLTIEISPLGSGSVSLNPQNPGNIYAAGTIVTLTAYANTGYKFSHWGGSVERSTSPVIAVLMDSNKTIIANFTQITSSQPSTDYYSLTINIEPQGSGEVNKMPNLTSYRSGTIVTLQAISATGYYFVEWTGDITSRQNPTSIIITSNKIVTAHFAEIPSGNYSLDITLNPIDGGAVTKTPNKSYYMLGEEVTLTVTPNEGYTFEGWSGNLTGEQNPVTITITGNMKITANFLRNQYILNVTIQPHNTGIVEKDPNYEWYYQNDKVTLNAIPLQGYKFIGWSGDITSTENPITITMNSDKNITATFEQLPQEQYIVAIQLVPSSASALWITKDPDKPLYSYGEQVTLSASPPVGKTFIKWSIDGVDYTQNPITITIIKNTTVTAYFQ